MRFTKFLAIILLATQVGINSTWAEETVGTENQYSGLPTIHFYLSEENFLIISVSGLLIGDAKGFTWNGMEISELMQQYQQSGIIELSERTDGFDLKVNVDVEALGESNEFGILYGGNNKLSSTFKTKDLLVEYSSEDRGFYQMRISGHIQYKKPNCWFWNCWEDVRNTSVSITVAGAGSASGLGMKTNYSTSTGSNGNYTIDINDNCGSVTVTASYNGKTGSKYESVWLCSFWRKEIKADIDIK